MVFSREGSHCSLKLNYDDIETTSVEIYHRMVPSVKRCWETFSYTTDSQMLLVRSRDAESHGIEDLTGLGQYTPFRTAGVLDNKCQEEVFEILTDGLVERTFKGRNSMYVALGTPGSGKTYTMAGLDRNKVSKGLLPRVASLLLHETELREDEYISKITVSCLEFFPLTETFIDLNSSRPVSQRGGPLILNCAEIPIKKEEEVFKILSKCYKNRSTLHGGAHDRALIVTFSLHLESKVFSDHFTYHPKVMLVESPGWRNDPSTTKMISDFALYLGGVKPPGLGRTANKFVAFLDTFWKTSFVRVICHFHGKKEDRKKSLAVLTFCDGLSRQRTHIAIVQKIPDNEKIIEFYKTEVQRLERCLLDCRRQIGYHGTEWLSRRDVEQLESLCKQFISGDISSYALLSIADPDQIVEALRSVALRSLSFRSSDGQVDNVKKKDSKTNRKETAVERKKKGDKKIPATPSVRTPSGIVPTSNKSAIETDGETPGLKVLSEVRANPLISNARLNKPVFEEKTPEIIYHTDLIYMPSRSSIWSEFFVRYPELTNKLNFAQKSLEQAEEDRDICYEEFQVARQNLRKIKMDLEVAKWKRKMEIGDEVDYLGRVIMNDEERALAEREQAKENTYNHLKSRAYEAAKTYLTANTRFLEMKSEIEERFDEYCRTAYGNISLTFELEDVKDSLPSWPTRPLTSKFPTVDMPDIDMCNKKAE